MNLTLEIEVETATENWEEISKCSWRKELYTLVSVCQNSGKNHWVAMFFVYFWYKNKKCVNIYVKVTKNDYVFVNSETLLKTIWQFSEKYNR